jgi:hypothetical protein
MRLTRVRSDGAALGRAMGPPSLLASGIMRQGRGWGEAAA